MINLLEDKDLDKLSNYLKESKHEIKSIHAKDSYYIDAQEVTASNIDTIFYNTLPEMQKHLSEISPTVVDEVLAKKLFALSLKLKLKRKEQNSNSIEISDNDVPVFVYAF